MIHQQRALSKVAQMYVKVYLQNLHHFNTGKKAVNCQNVSNILFFLFNYLIVDDGKTFYEFIDFDNQFTDSWTYYQMKSIVCGRSYSSRLSYITKENPYRYTIHM